MLTIKHIEDDGCQGVCSATHLAFYPKSDSIERDTLHAFGVGAASVSGDDRNGYSSGTVYVMNERGATIASYHLGPPLAAIA